MSKWIKCKNCGHEFSSVLSHCPKCSKWHLTAKALTGFIIGAALCVVVVIGIITGFSDKGKTNLNNNTNESAQTEKEVGKDNNSAPDASTAKDNVSDESSDAEDEKEIITSSTDDTTIQNNQTDIMYPIGTVVKNNFVYTTVPKFYLDYLYEKFGVSKALTFESFAYTLNDDDKQYGYTKIIQNDDGSATKLLPYSKITPVTAARLTNSFSYIKETEKAEFVEKVNHNDKLDEFEIILKVDNLNEEQKSLFMRFGTYFLEYQYSIRNGSNKCELSLVYADNTKEVISFPKAIK